MTPAEKKTVEYYAWRVSKPAKRGPWVIMPLENAHVLQRLAGEKESPHELSACRVSCERVIGWLRRIADNHKDAPQEIVGGW